MSAAANTASALGATCAPAARYASSVAPMPAPAPVSTSTLCPCATISRTEDGVRPTRYSWFLISFGTPMCILPPVWDCRSAAKWSDSSDAQHERRALAREAPTTLTHAGGRIARNDLHRLPDFT